MANPLHKKLNLAVCILALSVFSAAAVYGYLLLETDGACTAVRGVSYGDGLAMAVSARIKHLHHVWSRPYVDEPQYIMLPFHNFLVWLGYQSHGLTLSGYRFFSFLSILALKLLLAGLALRWLGFRYFIGSLLFLAVYFPLNEASRMGNPEVIQMSLLFGGLCLMAWADQRRSTLALWLSGLILALAFLYKTNIFVLPLLPAAYFLLKKYFVKETSYLLAWRQGMVPVYLGAILTFGVYGAFWVIPHLEQALWLAMRAQYVGATGLGQMIMRLADPLLLQDPWGIPFTEANFLWMAASLALTATLMLIRRSLLTKMDLLFLAFVLVMTLHLAVSLPSWRKAYALIPMGCWAVIRLTHLAFNHRNLDFTNRLGAIPWLVASFCIYVMLNGALHFAGLSQPLVIMLSALGAAPLTYGLVRLFRIRTVAYPLIVLALLLAASLGAVRHGYAYFFDNSFHIKRQSLAMGQMVGRGRVYGGYIFHLYNQTEAYYLSTWTAGLKPIGLRWAEDQGLSVAQWTEKYKFKSSAALKMWLAEKLFPGFYSRWQLPPNYRELFHSDLILTPPPSAMTVSHRYLVKGASEKELYLTSGWAKNFAKLTNKIPILGPEVMRLRMIPRFPDQKPGFTGLHRVAGWELKKDKGT